MPVDFKQPRWDADKYPGRHVAPVGAHAGARELAANVYELDPGVVGSPLHVHHANEELLLVLAGTLSLRGSDGTQLLPAGTMVAFPPGRAGAHSLVNRSDAPVRYLVVSTANRPDVVEYPDVGATLVVLAEQRLAYPPGADADQKPVIAEAMRAAADRETPDLRSPLLARRRTGEGAEIKTLVTHRSWLRWRSPALGAQRGFGDTLSMANENNPRPHAATVAEAGVVAALLDRFNREFDTPSPGPAVLTERLERLLASREVVALVAGEPAVGIALLTLRPNVWYEGPVALLDELYVVPQERGHGIGRTLLKSAEAWCRQCAAELLEVNVDGEDVDARRFYERHGYSDRDPGQTQPQLYYHRDLASPDR